MKWIKKNFFTILLVLILIIGLSLLLYPTISDYWNSFHQSKAIATYAEDVAKIEDDQYEELWQNAISYNQKLKEKKNRWVLTKKERKFYNKILNVSGNGIIGYVEIPKIKVSLPIYHGVDEGILQIAAGHIEGTSFPVGGPGTHCVLSGHRGLPSAKLFTDLDQMEAGDLFMLRVLDETLTYEVDEIHIVEPGDLSNLDIEEGRDLCTLVTCTPYGVNSHRLLVRGHRVENTDTETIRVTADAQLISPKLVAPVVAVPILLVLLILVMVRHRKGRGGWKREK